MGISMVENQYVEYTNIGAGVVGGFENTVTAELKPTNYNYNQSINEPDDEALRARILNEHDRMVKHKMFDMVQREIFPAGTKPIDSTWACKKKKDKT